MATIADTNALIAILGEAKELLSRTGNDFIWSSWIDADKALQEVDRLLEALRNGQIPVDDLEFLFLPTGDLQEVSLASGWADAFLDLANRFDEALGV